MKEGNINIFKKSIRQRRAISSNIFENASYNGSEEERNKSKNSIKSFHRKTTSSYFYGSYLSSNLENDLLNNLNIDEINNLNNWQNRDEIIDKKEKEKEKKPINSLNLIKRNPENDNYDPIFNVSFHSYELDNSNNNSVIVKTEESINDNNKNTNDNKQKTCKKYNKNNDKLCLNSKENKYNAEKSFLSFKNNLKYIKDKEERATQSYLLALGMTTKQNKKEEKEQYLPTSSIIEEEKSDLIESKSEFSNKKRNKKNNIFSEDSLNNNNKIFFVQKENKLKIKNDIENKNDNGTGNTHFINVNRNKKNIIGKIVENNIKENDKLNIKLSIALNDIINKNNKKEENKRKYLKKNKTILLNSFFNMTYKGKKIKFIDKEINNEKFIKSKDITKKTENNNNEIGNRIEIKYPFLNKKKIENSYISNLIKKRFNTENSDPRRSFKNNILKNTDSKFNRVNENKNIKYNNLNNSINSNLNINKNITFIKKENKSIKSNIPLITKIESKQRSKIPHLRQKNIDKNENKENYTINKYTAKNKKYYTKIVNIPHKKAYSFSKDQIFGNGRDNYKLHSMKQMKTINEALCLIRIDRINSKKKNKASSKNNKTKNSNSSSFTRATRSNSKSSRSKEKKIVIYKTNSSSLNYRNELSFNLLEEKAWYPSNKMKTLIFLKEYLFYTKLYVKNDVLEKIVKTFNSDNSFFIIFCEKYSKSENDKLNGNNNIKIDLNKNFLFSFKSLMKYYQNQNRFIKIYGDENAPNVISVKNIDINNYYIYRVKENYKGIDKIVIELINELIFTNDAIIFYKKS